MWQKIHAVIVSRGLKQSGETLTRDFTRVETKTDRNQELPEWCLMASPFTRYSLPDSAEDLAWTVQELPECLFVNPFICRDGFVSVHMDLAGSLSLPLVINHSPHSKGRRELASIHLTVKLCWKMLARISLTWNLSNNHNCSSIYYKWLSSVHLSYHSHVRDSSVASSVKQTLFTAAG